MNEPQEPDPLHHKVRQELRQLVALQPSDRLWQMPIGAALASGLPLLAGAAVGHIEFGLVASLGGLVFLYLPDTPLAHRMVMLMACAFGMGACFALGLLSHVHAALVVPVLALVAMLATMVCRFYGVGLPGGFFFVMTAAIGAHSPIAPMQLPHMVGLFTLGTVLAGLIAFLYSLVVLRVRPAGQVPQARPPSFDYVVLDAVVIGAFVGLSLVLANLLGLQKPYWVPMSCMAVIQGASLRAVWTRPFYRILGTGIGLLLALALMSVRMTPWEIALAMMLLTFLVETLVVRNYAFATVFITPLALLLAEAASLGHADPAALVRARFLDTLLGCAVGLAGGICLHSPRFRSGVGGLLLRARPSRFVR